MTAERKKIFLIGGLGAAGLIALYLLWKRGSGSSGVLAVAPADATGTAQPVVAPAYSPADIQIPQLVGDTWNITTPPSAQDATPPIAQEGPGMVKGCDPCGDGVAFAGTATQRFSGPAFQQQVENLQTAVAPAASTSRYPAGWPAGSSGTI